MNRRIQSQSQILNESSSNTFTFEERAILASVQRAGGAGTDEAQLARRLSLEMHIVKRALEKYHKAGLVQMQDGRYYYSNSFDSSDEGDGT